MKKFLRSYGLLIFCVILLLVQIQYPQKVMAAVIQYSQILQGDTLVSGKLVVGMREPYSALGNQRQFETYSMFNITDDYNRHGLHVTNEVQKTIAGDYRGVAVGGLSQVYVGAGNTQNFVNPNYGMIGFAAHTKTQPYSRGWVTWAQDLQAFGEFDGMGAVNHAGLFVLNGYGNIKNQYGIYIQGQNVGSISNRAIKSESGAWEIGGSSPLIFGNGWYLKPDGAGMKLYKANGTIAASWN